MISPVSVKAAADLESSICRAFRRCSEIGMEKLAISTMLEYISASLCVEVLEDLEDIAAGALEEGRQSTAEDIDLDEVVSYTTERLNKLLGGHSEVPRP